MRMAGKKIYGSSREFLKPCSNQNISGEGYLWVTESPLKVLQSNKLSGDGHIF